jgi:hypothetical protein
MKEPKDKRTKAYKQWKLNQEKVSKGVGDTISKVTKVLGIDKAVKFIAGEDCGCEERRVKLNKIFTYKTPECLTEKEYNYLSDYFSKVTYVVTPVVQKRLFEIYNRVFHKNKNHTSCVSCVAEVVRELKNYLNFYNK